MKSAEIPGGRVKRSTVTVRNPRPEVRNPALQSSPGGARSSSGSCPRTRAVAVPEEVVEPVSRRLKRRRGCA
eukprot:11223092-Alexandrium_andersonii.AAC.1